MRHQRRRSVKNYSTRMRTCLTGHRGMHSGFNGLKGDSQSYVNRNLCRPLRRMSCPKGYRTTNGGKQSLYSLSALDTTSEKKKNPQRAGRCLYLDHYRTTKVRSRKQEISTEMVECRRLEIPQESDLWISLPTSLVQFRWCIVRSNEIRTQFFT